MAKNKTEPVENIECETEVKMNEHLKQHKAVDPLHVAVLDVQEKRITQLEDKLKDIAKELTQASCPHSIIEITLDSDGYVFDRAVCNHCGKSLSRTREFPLKYGKQLYELFQ